jgi:hypothetical protein
MSKCLWSAALIVLGSGPASLAKPPDLPVDLGVVFEEADPKAGIVLDVDLVTGKLSLGLSLPWPALREWLSEALPVSNVTGSKGRLADIDSAWTGASGTNSEAPPASRENQEGFIQ